jgi:hypothetical protein
MLCKIFFLHLSLAGQGFGHNFFMNWLDLPVAAKVCCGTSAGVSCGVAWLRLPARWKVLADGQHIGEKGAQRRR